MNLSRGGNKFRHLVLSNMRDFNVILSKKYFHVRVPNTSHMSKSPQAPPQFGRRIPLFHSVLLTSVLLDVCCWRRTSPKPNEDESIDTMVSAFIIEC